MDLLAVQGTLKSLLQHHSSKASILQRSAFFRVQLSHPYMATGKTVALTRWTFVGKVISAFGMLQMMGSQRAGRDLTTEQQQDGLQAFQTYSSGRVWMRELDCKEG